MAHASMRTFLQQKQEVEWYAHEDNHQPYEDPRRDGIRTNGTIRAVYNFRQQLSDTGLRVSLL